MRPELRSDARVEVLEATRLGPVELSLPRPLEERRCPARAHLDRAIQQRTETLLARDAERHRALRQHAREVELVGDATLDALERRLLPRGHEALLPRGMP